MNMLVTFGQGLKQAHGRRVEVDGVQGLAKALEQAPAGIEGWWSPHIWREDTRDSEAWQSASAIGIDLDYEGHANLPLDLAVELEQLADRMSISGSIFHRTPAGARVVFVLAAPCTDAALFETLAKGAARGVEDDLREHNLSRLGLALDPVPHLDLARLYFQPNTTAKGVQRSARVIVMRPVPYPTDTLRELAGEVDPVPASHPALAIGRHLTAVTDPAKRAAAYIAKMGPSVEGNRGDDHAFKVAAVLVNDFALPDSDAWAVLAEWNTTCQPPWSDKDLMRFLRSAGKNAKRAPGAKLLENRPPPHPTRPRTAKRPEPTSPPELDEKPKKGIPLIRACDAVEKPVRWIIENFLARGELTDLSGDPGMGKGLISASWAAQVTRTLPDATVIFFATEDPLGRLKARLRAEGADLARVLFLDITQPDASPILPGDVAEVETIVREHRTALLVLDPALEFMDGELDSYKQADVGRFTAPLLAMAMRTDAALLTVRHNTKAVGASALHRAAGSIGFSGKARIVLTAAKNHETGERALAMVKNNLGADRLTVAYSIVARDGASVITWGEAISLTADELVNQEPGKKKRGPSPEKLESAVDLLRSMLARGPMRVDDILRCARAEGVGRTTIYEARHTLKVAKITLDLHPAWRLPENETPDCPELTRSNSGFSPGEDS